MKIFWSWQSDLGKRENRRFIKDALDRAILDLKEDAEIDVAARGKLALDHDTKGLPGAAEIAREILNKVANCDVFVCDLTPIGATADGKALPNPNVAIELGYALHSPGPGRVIIVLNEASGYKPDDLPFDVRHRRVMPYSLAPGTASDARKRVFDRLVSGLSAAIKSNLADYTEAQAAESEISGEAASPKDRSIWASAGAVLSHNDSMLNSSVRNVDLILGARSYIRVIPSGWPERPPSARAVQDVKGGADAIGAPTGGGMHGDFGTSKDGFVDYWVASDKDGATRDVMCYFQRSGELWYLNGSVFAAQKEQVILAVNKLVANWSIALRRSLKFYDRNGAFKARRVEVGITGLKNVRWPGITNAEKTVCFTDDIFHSRQSSDWSDVSQTKFLREAYDKLTDAFSKHRLEGDKFENFVDTLDEGRISDREKLERQT